MCRCKDLCNHGVQPSTCLKYVIVLALQNQYEYPEATVGLGFLDNINIQKMQGFKNNARTTQKKYKMNVGTYIVKVRIDFNPQWEKDFDVNLAVYAEYPCIITLASQQ